MTAPAVPHGDRGWRLTGLPVVAGVTGVAVLVALATVWMGPLPALGAAAALLACVPVVWIVSSPRRALVVYAFAIPIDVYLSTTLRVTSTQLLQVVIVAGWVVHAALATTPPAGERREHVLPYRIGVAFIVFLLLSLTWAASLEASSRSVARMLAAMVMGAYAAEYADRHTLTRVARALCAGALVTTLYGYGQWLRGGYDPLYQFFSPFYSDPFISRGGGFAIVGTFANPNILAGYLLIVLPLAWAALVSTRGTARLASLGVTLVLVGGLLLTFSKASWLLLGLLASLWVLARLPVGATLALGTTVGVAVGFALLFLEPLLRTLLFLFPNTREASVDTRLALWWAAVNVFLERPILGFGLDGFAGATSGIRTGVLADLVRAHNMYLQTLVDLGLVGSALLWSTCAIIVRRGLRALGSAAPGTDPALHLGLVLGASAFFLYGLVETLAVSNQYVNTTWLVVGLLAASSRSAHEGDR